MGLAPDYWRQLDVFNPTNFKTPVHIIGVGATGSWIALVLAKMGVQNITAWDFDCVEVHNLPNQIYGLEEVGLLKVEALKKILYRDCGVEITAKAERVDGSQKLSGIVYICVDTMSARREIWEKSLKLNIGISLVVETRLGAELGLIYTIRPLNPRDIKGYENTLYSDEEAEESPCTYRAISTVVSSIAGLASNKVVESTKEEKISSKINLKNGDTHESIGMICFRPVIVTAAAW